MEDTFDCPVWLEYPLDLFSTSWPTKTFCITYYETSQKSSLFARFPERKIFFVPLAKTPWEQDWRLPKYFLVVAMPNNIPF